MASILLSLIILLTPVLVLGFWAMRRQSRQYPKGTRIPMDEERKSEPGRWTGMSQGGGRG